MAGRAKKSSRLRGKNKKSSQDAAPAPALDSLLGPAEETDAAHLARHQGKAAAAKCARCKPLACKEASLPWGRTCCGLSDSCET